MELILSEKAYRLILNECQAAPKTETGGILIGKKIDEQRFVVPFAVGPGLKSKRTRFRFSPDVEWQQIRLEKLFRRYGVDYLGSYHLHHGTDCLPSFVDFEAARQIVSDPEWGIKEAVFPIINLAGQEMEFHPYYFSRASQGFQRISWRVVSHKGSLIKQALQKREA